MKRRKALAALTLLAILSFPVASSEIKGLDGMMPGAQWGYALDMNREESLILAAGGAIMCGFIPGIGSVACGLAGAF